VVFAWVVSLVRSDPNQRIDVYRRGPLPTRRLPASPPCDATS
jgi:hypothetical protein